MSNTNALERIAPGSLDGAMKLCNDIASSDIAPGHFRGKPGAVYVAHDFAQRTGMALLAVMQNLYVVKGNPAWKGSFCKALIEHSRAPSGGLRYRKIKYEFQRDKTGRPTACRMVAVDVDGDMVEGTWITAAMVEGEGWSSNSKWKNMEEQMYKYRAASFFLRAECPDAALGLLTVEEHEDIASVAQAAQTFTAPPEPGKLPASAAEDAEVIDEGQELTVEHELAAQIEAAPDVAALKRAGREVDSAHKKGQVDEAARKRLLELYKARNAVLTNASGSQGGLPV